ncbi:MAG: hypothetical protein JW795_10740 [Chitinivibrionales bacterium]|nr:hypothetical protein [Chitinivibrionales bacterium]
MVYWADSSPAKQSGRYSHLILVLLIITLMGVPGQASRIDLHYNWRLQSSQAITASDSVLSTADYSPVGWYPVTVPSTVLAGLAANNQYTALYSGKNLTAVQTNQFETPWWYRTEFVLAQREKGKRIFLQCDGINYKANIWLNGTKIADTAEVIGTYRRFEFDITNAVTFEQANVLCLEVYRPYLEKQDLAIFFVDWAPAPPDQNMGLFQKVSIKTSGAVTVEAPYVDTRFDLPDLSRAYATVFATLNNRTDSTLTATVECSIEQVRISTAMSLKPHETHQLRLSSSEFKELAVASPRIWWPWQMGSQELYTLVIKVMVNGVISDSGSCRFGMRQAHSQLTEKNNRQFFINGKPILIRGAGWAPDLLQRIDEKRQELEVALARNCNLNTIRLEGKLENDRFYDLCDSLGMLVMPGWCCGRAWEEWNSWDAKRHFIACQSQRSQILRIRHHPSVFVWLNGSDRPPIEPVERAYLSILDSLDWRRPVLSSATGALGPVSGVTGVKMCGPYDWVAPVYWYSDTTRGGAFSFNTETSPGPAIAQSSSVQQMIPHAYLWPINDFWTYHCGLAPFDNLSIFSRGITNRFGEPRDFNDYIRKSHLLSYESHRAMFEAFSANKYTATGVIQWMLNNAWPSLIWHLYDYFLRPSSSYYATKVACEPLHIQYSYHDRSVVVVNSLYRPFDNLTAAALVYGLGGDTLWQSQAGFSIGSDESKRLFAIPPVNPLSKAYFLRLTIIASDGRSVSVNSYWLSTQEDVPDYAASNWFHTPNKEFADFTGLENLPTISLNFSSIHTTGGNEDTVTATVKNPATAFGVGVILSVVKNTDLVGIDPVFWDDNNFLLCPQEQRQVKGRIDSRLLQGTRPLIKVEGFNIRPAIEGISALDKGKKEIRVKPHSYTVTVFNLQGRKIFSLSSKQNVNQVVQAYALKSMDFLPAACASGVYVVRLELKNVAEVTIDTRIQTRFLGKRNLHRSMFR